MSATLPTRFVLTTSLGEIEIAAWGDVAPQHVASFARLSASGFYEGLLVHRVIPGFVVQAGCPEGDGTGGPGWSIPAEFSGRPHELGVLSMARSIERDSAGSQFFICLSRESCTHLDGNYSAFGKVTRGMDVLERLAAVECERSGRPVDPPRILKLEAFAS
ncbi:MAG: peptidylprolyl isomerase [Planctomycetes bacterium]|nr:peptidylprolyl isomerase [Planctomycetota bacterium]